MITTGISPTSSGSLTTAFLLNGGVLLFGASVELGRDPKLVRIGRSTSGKTSADSCATHSGTGASQLPSGKQVSFGFPDNLCLAEVQ